MAVRERPAGRYGAPRSTRSRRWWYWALLAVFVVAGTVVAYVAYQNLGANPIDPEVTSYHVVDDGTVTATFTVDRDHPDQAADCIIYALSADGSEVARGEVYVPPSETTIQLSDTLRTDKRATTVEFYGCSYQVPPYLTKSMPPSG
ncbi:MAG TPA: DUF4307 domain-containing protein [Pseudonocardiaceae bacterium]|jgi:hypothetical protein|nr:DUF4307 domain-containing protein [Pseudonocardiaceae bacterium]